MGEWIRRGAGGREGGGGKGEWEGEVGRGTMRSRYEVDWLTPKIAYTFPASPSNPWSKQERKKDELLFRS